MIRFFAAMRISLVGFFMLGLGFAVPQCPVAAAEQKQTARPQIGQPVQEAEQFLKQKKFKEALDKLHAADAIPDKTPYERFVIEGTRAAVALNSGDYALASHALEAVLATGILALPDALARVEALVQINSQLKNYPQVIDYASRYYREGGTEEGPRLLLAQAYYLQNDFAGAAKTIRLILQADEKSGKRPDENLLLALLNSEQQQKNEAGRIEVLQILAATYPKPDYWADLLAAIQKKPGFSSRLTLDVDRLMIATGAMKTTDDYMQAAQLALLAGLPGDAKAFLDKGAAAGVLGKGATAERVKRLADMADRQASDDVKSLTQLGAETDAASNGLASVKLGDAYASYGQYDKAIDAYQKGLKRGGLQQPDDARLHLAIAYLQNNQKPKAKDSFDAVLGKDGSRDLAQLWLIEGGFK
jgi:tetratricopeptide (TPR) repeat protein